MKKYLLLILISLLFSAISKAQYVESLDYLNLEVGKKSTNEHKDNNHLLKIILPIEHTAFYSQNIIKYFRCRITLYRNDEKVYSKIHTKYTYLRPYELDYITFYINVIFPFNIDYDEAFDIYVDFLPYEKE